MKSALFFDWRILFISVSAESSGFAPAIALRRNAAASSSSAESSSSSRRVPYAEMLIAGQMRSSATFLSSTISILPVPLTS